jgi:hypothetical protein
MYAVVYGPEWEDMMFFGDRMKALRKLCIQMFGYKENRFMPQMHEWNLGDDGVYKRCKQSYVVNIDRWAQYVVAEDDKVLDDEQIMNLIDLV